MNNEHSAEPILELKNLCKTFGAGTERETPAVQDVSLRVFPGEIVGIVGESGCGKSTIARLVTKLEPLTSGSVFFDGEDLSKIKEKHASRIYRKIQMVFQDPFSVFSPRMRIGTFLEEGLVFFGVCSRTEARKEAVKLLEMVELSSELLDRLPHQLSGGQLQRVVIARAISIHPKLLFLDEATSALDVSVQKQILKLLIRLQQEFNLTYIFIGHDLAVVRSIADRIAVMYAGRIVEEFDSCELETSASHPYTHKLLKSVFSVNDRDTKQIILETLSMEDGGYEKQGCVYQRRCPFISDRCRLERPELVEEELASHHRIACWSPLNRDCTPLWSSDRYNFW